MVLSSWNRYYQPHAPQFLRQENKLRPKLQLSRNPVNHLPSFPKLQMKYTCLCTEEKAFHKTFEIFGDQTWVRTTHLVWSRHSSLYAEIMAAVSNVLDCLDIWTKPCNLRIDLISESQWLLIMSLSSSLNTLIHFLLGLQRVLMILK